VAVSSRLPVNDETKPATDGKVSAMSRCPRCRNRVDPTFTTHCPECGQALVAGVDSMNVPSANPAQAADDQSDRRRVSLGGRRAFTWLVRIILLLMLVFGARICSYADRLLDQLPREAAIASHRAA
jgi:hypothetical protein